MQRLESVEQVVVDLWVPFTWEIGIYVLSKSTEKSGLTYFISINLVLVFRNLPFQK